MLPRGSSPPPTEERRGCCPEGHICPSRQHPLEEERGRSPPGALLNPSLHGERRELTSGGTQRKESRSDARIPTPSRGGRPTPRLGAEARAGDSSPDLAPNNTKGA